MSTINRTEFENFLLEHDAPAWSATVTELLGDIHEVDRNATEIWFKFYPLTLWSALEHAQDREALEKRLLLQGTFNLKDQIDTSHSFLYGHRYWPEVKKEVEAYASGFPSSGDTSLGGAIRKVAEAVSNRLKVESSLVLGITAVAFMTLLQAGHANFVNAAGTIDISKKRSKKSPDQILSERARDEGQGLFGFLKTVDKEWTVNYDEADPNARFKAINEEELASAAARDQSQDWRARDQRCIEGPIPVECRSASCGTCWVGVLSGAEKLTDVKVREAKMIKEFGYINTDEPKPIIRLACMAQATGAVSIVIPPWNGIFGKPLMAEASAEAPVNAGVVDNGSVKGLAN
jgi:ferredoxin